MRYRLLTVVLLALAAPAAASARGSFDPSKEFEQHDWLPIHLGPLNLSITKAVAYLLIGSGLTILLGISLMRVKMPGRRQAVGEMIYEIAQTQVAEQDRQHCPEHQIDDGLRDREVERAEVDREPLVLLELL